LTERIYWTFEYATGYQAGLAKGMEIHASAIQASREAEKEFEETFDSAITKGYQLLLAELDQIILKTIEKGDTP